MLINEFNYVMNMPLLSLGFILILFLILMNSLSLVNLLIFVVIYLLFTRTYVNDEDEESEPKFDVK
jgi:Ca2+/Na+ antiporter